MTNPEKIEGWEKEVWAWITKEMPHKHSDRFIPLFKIIRNLLSQTRQTEKERIKKIIEKLQVEKPRTEKDEDLYEIKSAWLLETKKVLQDIIKNFP